MSAASAAFNASAYARCDLRTLRPFARILPQPCIPTSAHFSICLPAKTRSRRSRRKSIRISKLAEIHRRVIDQGGPALLFKRVKGSRYPVVTNLFGTKRRIELAFGPKPEAIVRELVQVAESLLPPRPAELWKHRSLGRELLRLGTKNTTRSPVTQVRDQPPRLDELPVLTTWQEDGGPFITLPLVYTENPVTKKHNLGIYRMQVYDAHTTGLHWQIQKGGGFHYTEAERLGQPLAGNCFSGWPTGVDSRGDRAIA